MNSLIIFFRKPIFSDKRFLLFIWIILGVIGSLKGSKIHNNYLIFKGVFNHTIQQINLYTAYPSEYHDSNHYGPFFSLIIAPFTFLPDQIGVLLWNVSMGLCLFIAFYCLPIQWRKMYLFFYIVLIQLYTCIMNSQTNGLIAALIIGSFLFIRKEKDFWAACFIMLGVFIKLYGIVGLSFFFFSKHKGKFIAYLFFWAAVFFVLPMLISSPEFIIQSYYDWYASLSDKSIENMTNFSQDMSAIGLVRRIFNIMDASALYVIIPGIILFGLQYIKTEKYGQLTYQLGILASTLLFMVLFSTGSESETYIIALTGVSIWFFLQEEPNKKWVIFLLLFTIFWTWITTSHLLPRSIRVDIFKRYSLKALPCLAVWLILVYQIITSRGIIKLSNPDEL